MAGNLPSNNKEWYEGAAKCYSQDGFTFLDLFNADEYVECRKENLFYPFASREEWEVADFLPHSALSMAAIDTFLQLSMGPSWKCQIIPSLHAMKNLIRLFWRDLVDCLESLFSNPLFHNQLDFIPCHVYKTALQLLCVYSEWLMGDAAWSIQDQLPQGATILGTILSSDKTNITMMTGARVAHPLLLGLANIRMRTHMKLSSKAFVLTALLPILQYLHPNQQMWGMLEDRLIHECLLIILQPLMKAAELGIMMADPVGNIHHCFTLLTAYIVDTPEACMLACVCGKTSPFTLAFINVDPNDLEAFFATCAEFWLNGVFAPFWKGWRFSDPAIFLTLEALHHWHKQFYDHDLQWCYFHFSNRISKLKQVMGRVHHDIQCYIIGLIAGAAPCRFSPAPDNDLLASIDRSLAIFHDNKDVIMTLGARMGTKRVIDNWHIPKLELMQSVTTSAHQVSALIQWSVDATGHAHITEIKDPAWHTNNNDYDPQICWDEDKDEKVEEEENGEINGPMDLSLATARHDGTPQTRPPHMFLAGSTTVHLNCNPTRTGLKIDEVADQFNIPDLRYALSDFLQRDARNGNGVFGVGVPRRSLIDRPLNIPFERIQVWHTVHLQQVCLHDSRVVLPAQTMHASPPCPGSLVLIYNLVTLTPFPSFEGHAVCKLQLIMCPIPRQGSSITWHDQYLCYVHSFKIGAIDSATKMHTLAWAKHANGILVGDIVPLMQLQAFVNIILKLGAAADPRLTKSTSVHYHSSFYLNKYFNKQIYDTLYYVLQG
ncbi:hypothetical protein BDR06DRAFT_980181 [Suillus hirtellus]|nr:hypothetical protein BDR06DRAFT_980181 [Suillus hirtellus]